MWVDGPQPLGGDSVVSQIVQPGTVMFSARHCLEMRRDVTAPFLVEENRQCMLQFDWLDFPHDLGVIMLRSDEDWVMPVVVSLGSPFWRLFRTLEDLLKVLIGEVSSILAQNWNDPGRLRRA